MTDLEPYVVVGAGPTAAAAAKALVAAGRRVIVLDTGLALEPEREAARRRMAASGPAGWPAGDVALTRYSAAATSGAGYKRSFGSDVAFRDDGALDLAAGAAVGARPSYALGGLSNVWGAGVLPYTADDMAAWPIGPDNLAEDYRRVFEFVPQAGEDDELSRRYPPPSPLDGPLLRSEVAERLLARMRARGAACRFHFGAARLAVRVGHPAPEQGCSYCAHCLDGCPYGHIYNAAQTIDALRDDGLVEYRPGLHVDSLEERAGEVVINGTPLERWRQTDKDGYAQSGGGRGVSVRARRVFLAAGALSSTVIMQRSGLLPARVELLDSQTLYLPFLWLGPTGRTGREPGHTLAQLFVVLDDPEVCAHPVHVSL